MADRLYMSSPDVTDLERAALDRAIQSGWIAPLGPEVDAFEAELAGYVGRAHCVVLSSGTAALHLGLLTMGIGPGDHVLTSSMTFAATANAIAYTGANPVFVDADETGNIDVELLEQAMRALAEEGISPAAIVPVDLLGKVVDHARIAELAAEFSVPVLADAAESLGAARDGRASAAYGNAAAVSFNGNKIMTTSGGGALLTDDAEFAKHVRYLATQARQPVVHYEHTDIGYNYRLSNLLAALGRAQLSRLDAMIERRYQHRRFYTELFDGVPGVSMFGEPSGAPGEPTRDNWWLTSILVDPSESGFSRDDLMQALAEENIESRPLWKPMHLQPVYRAARAFENGTSERCFQLGLSLPSGSVMADDQRDRVAEVVQRVISR